MEFCTLEMYGTPVKYLKPKIPFSLYEFNRVNLDVNFNETFLKFQSSKYITAFKYLYLKC